MAGVLMNMGKMTFTKVGLFSRKDNCCVSSPYSIVMQYIINQAQALRHIRYSETFSRGLKNVNCFRGCYNPTRKLINYSYLM